MKEWGRAIDGLQPEDEWFYVEPGTLAECGHCGTYREADVLSYVPDADYVRPIASQIGRGVFGSTDGQILFGIDIAAAFIPLVESGAIVQIGETDVFTFELRLLESVLSRRNQTRRASTCPVCGQTSPIYPGSAGGDTIELSSTPKSPVVRSAEFFRHGVKRRPRIYVSRSHCDKTGLPLWSWRVFARA